MTSAFLAKVVSGDDDEWIVDPLITEYDGTPHPSITVTTQEGITPNVDDIVLVLTMRNNLDREPISRFYDASESNGVIIGVVTAPNGFTLTGDFNFIGDVTIDGNLSVTGMFQTGQLAVQGDSAIGGNLVVAGSVACAALTAASALIAGDAIIGGKSFLGHMHAAGTYTVTTAPGVVAGTSGGLA